MLKAVHWQLWRPSLPRPPRSVPLARGPQGLGVGHPPPCPVAPRVHQGPPGALRPHLTWVAWCPAGERQLPQHQPGDPDAGPPERAAAPVPAAAAAHGAQQEVPRLPAQQLPQPAALLAAALPAQGQGQHLPGERECPQPRGWRLGCGAARRAALCALTEALPTGCRVRPGSSRRPPAPLSLPRAPASASPTGKRPCPSC